MNGNKDTKRVKSISDKVSFTPSLTSVELIDELSSLSTDYPNDYVFGLMVRSIIHNVHTNLKS